MRLLRIDATGVYSLVGPLSDEEVQNYPYAILSHTWGEDEDEVSFEDMQNGLAQDKKGFRKIKYCGEQAARDKLEYFWVDTCCICKTDQAELSEAIYSMYRWFRNAQYCYVYLWDVHARSLTSGSNPEEAASNTWRVSFRKSRWFRRGWTLQELLAPPAVVFFSNEWLKLGEKEELAPLITDITGIATSALLGTTQLSDFTINEKMAWAADRETKRIEDRAYSLLGIFDVVLPHLYGIREKAFSLLATELDSSLKDKLIRNPREFLQLSRSGQPRSRSIALAIRTLNLYSAGAVTGASTGASSPDGSTLPPPPSNLPFLFAKCIELLDEIEASVYNKSDISYSVDRFRKQNTKLKKWGVAVGLINRERVSSINLQSTITSAVTSILTQIMDIFDDLELKRFFIINRKRLLTEQSETTEVSRQNLGRETSNWTAIRKQKFADSVQTFQELVDKLYKVSQLTNHGPGYRPQDDKEARVSKEAQQSNVMNWLNMSNFEQRFSVKNQYETQLSSHLDGTCDWFTFVPEYTSWERKIDEDGSSKILWVNGGPGFGKSVLCAKIIQGLKLQDERSIAYFFSTAHATAGGNPMFVVRSWVSQLVLGDPDVFAQVQDAFRTRENLMASDNDTWRLLKNILSYHRGIALFLDGFDEYPRTANNGRAEFLQNLKQYTSDTSARIFISSREEIDIKSELSPESNKMPGLDLLEYKLTKEAVNEDVKRYSQSVVEKKLPNKDQKLKGKLANQLAEKCDGMFLWIKLQEEQLRGSQNGKKLEKIVSNMPIGLNRTYERNWNIIIKRTDPDDKERAFAILRWIMFSQRPLSVLELSQALTIKISVDGDDVDLDELPDAIDDAYVDEGIIDLCGALIEVRRQDGNPKLESGTLHLIHSSVREFLLGVLPTSSGPPNSKTELSDYHSDLLRSCMAFLSHDEAWELEEQQEKLLQSNDSITNKESNEVKNIPEDVTNDNETVAVVPHKIVQDKAESDNKDIEKKNKPSQFLDYATRFWSLHFNSALKEDKASKEAVEDFLSLENKPFQKWAQKFENQLAAEYEPEDANNKEEKPIEVSIGTPLYYATYFDYPDMIEYIYKEDPDQLNVVGGRYGSPLQVACSKGHFKAFELLMQWKADPNVCSGDFGVAINAAASEGHKSMVKQLIDFGADTKLDDPLGRDALYNAARGGYIEIVEILLDIGVDIDNLAKRTSSNWPAISVATTKGRTEVVQLLIKRGANIHLKDAADGTPIFLAAYYGQLGPLKVLLEAGGDISTVDRDGDAPIMGAIVNGHLKIVEYLLELDPKLLKTENKWGEHPIYYATLKNHVDIVEFLIKSGADVNQPKNNGWTSIIAAASDNFMSIVKLLLSHNANINVRRNTGETACFEAANVGHFDMLKFLCDSGADPFIANEDGITVIHVACEKGYLDIVKYLVEEKGFDVNMLDNDKISPLYKTTILEQLDVMKYLIGKGADPKLKGYHNHTILTSAVLDNFVDMVTYILEEGLVNINDCTENGSTPCYFAAMKNKPKLLKLLVDYGGNPLTPRNDRYTPLHVSAETGFIEQCEYLLNETKAELETTLENGRTPLYSAALNGHVEVVKLLIERGANIHTRTKDGFTPLHAAAESHNLECVEVLINQPDGPNVRTISNDGYTPLYYACIVGDVPIAKFLIENGADVNHISESRFTPVHDAARGTSVEMLELMIKHGANLNCQNSSGWTPLRYAMNSDRTEIVEALLKHGADPTIADDTNRLPIHGATYNPEDDMFRILFAAMADLELDVWKTPENCLSQASLCCTTSSREYMHYILGQLRRKNSYDPSPLLGNTPLHLASYANDLKTVNHFLNNGYSFRDYDKTGRNCLHHACAGNAIDVVKLILENDPAIPIGDNKWTPLHWANRNGTPETIALLLAHGHEITSVYENDHEWTPLAIAKYNDNKTINWDEEDPDSKLTNAPKMSSAICDHCFCRIYGERWTCQRCHDLDVCFMCIDAGRSLHHDHEFVRVDDAEENEEGEKQDEPTTTDIVVES